MRNILFPQRKRNWPGQTSEPSIPYNGLGGAADLLRLVLEEQNRVWELWGQFMLGQFSPTQTSGLATPPLLCNLSRSDRAGKPHC